MTQRHPRKRKRRLKPWVPYAAADTDMAVESFDRTMERLGDNLKH